MLDSPKLKPTPLRLLGKFKGNCGTPVPPRQAKKFCRLDSESTAYLEHAMEEMGFSGRAYDRILKFARILANRGGKPNIRHDDLLKAIQSRSLDQKLFS